MIPSELTDLPFFTTHSALEMGVTGIDLRNAVNEGTIVRLMRGWYTAQPLRWPDDRHRLLVRIALLERKNTVPSHYSAAVHLKLPVHRIDWRVVHLMRTDGGPTQVRRGLTIHRRVGSASEVSVPLAIAQTTLVDVESGVMAFDTALREKQTTHAEVAQAAHLLRGRVGHARLATMLRLGDGRRESPLESRTAVVFDRWRLSLEPQFEVPGTRFRADARIAGTTVLVETDGLGKYDGPTAVTDEKAREDAIRAKGWEVVRVTDELLRQPRSLYPRVSSALQRAASASSGNTAA